MSISLLFVSLCSGPPEENYCGNHGPKSRPASAMADSPVSISSGWLHVWEPRIKPTGAPTTMEAQKRYPLAVDVERKWVSIPNSSSLFLTVDSERESLLDKSNAKCDAKRAIARLQIKQPAQLQTLQCRVLMAAALVLAHCRFLSKGKPPPAKGTRFSPPCDGGGPPIARRSSRTSD